MSDEARKSAGCRAGQPRELLRGPRAAKDFNYGGPAARAATAGRAARARTARGDDATVIGLRRRRRRRVPDVERPHQRQRTDRLIATAEAVITNGSGRPDERTCRIVLIGTDTRVIGSTINSQLPNGGYITVRSISAGADIQRRGTYDSARASATSR